MTISVIIPTFRRINELTRCLSALQKQQRPAEQVLVTVRDTDLETRAFLATRPAEGLLIQIVDVTEPGVIAAMNAALGVARGDVIALTDDDAAPWADWVERIEQHFAGDPLLGGVGGRDWQYRPGETDYGLEQHPGEMKWWGRVTAGHHDAAPGPPREVTVIKGVNCAYRAVPLKAVGFDTRLAGTGAQVHWELSLGLAMLRGGWKVVFDPALGVDHFPAVRFDEDQRLRFNCAAQRNAVANETLALWEHLPAKHRAAFFLWSALIGTCTAPGLVQVPRLAITMPRLRLMPRKYLFPLWWSTVRGRLQGLTMYRASRALDRAAPKPPSPAARAVANEEEGA